MRLFGTIAFTIIGAVAIAGGVCAAVDSAYLDLCVRLFDDMIASLECWHEAISDTKFRGVGGIAFHHNIKINAVQLNLDFFL